MYFKHAGLVAALTIFAPQAADSQVVSAAPVLTYADLADLALPAPVAAHLRVTGVNRLNTEQAPNVPTGYRRFLVQAEVLSLIRGTDGVAREVRYLVDLPNDSAGRPARIRRRDEVLVLAEPTPNRPGELRLIARGAQLPYTPEAAEQLRAILREAAAPDPAPRITGIGRAFHVPGSLPGESETQIFLQTADGRPVSLSVLRRPGERPSWSVALSEIVDNAAAPPQPNSLLWYRLACTLPQTLPQQSLREAAPDEARAIAADYRLVIERLGPCARNRPRD